MEEQPDIQIGEYRIKVIRQEIDGRPFAPTPGLTITGQCRVIGHDEVDGQPATVLEPVGTVTYSWDANEPTDYCLDCGALIKGHHACQGVPGGLGDD
jgi:hypothetical protein